MHLVRLALLGFAIVTAGSVSARDLFVNNNTGDDRWDGSKPAYDGNTAGPIRSIGRALKLSRRGDHIVLAKTDQPYRESITLSGPRHSGGVLSPFEIDGGGATLEGSRSVPARAWEHAQGDYFRFRPSGLGPHQMLFLDGVPAQRAADAGQKALPMIEPKSWFTRDPFVYFRAEEKKLPDQYALSHAVYDVGITLYGVENVVIHDLVVQGFRIDGVQAADNVRDCILSGLTLRGNGRSGAAVSGSSQLEIAACLVGSNAQAQVVCDGHSRTKLTNCDLVKEGQIPTIQRAKDAKVEETQTP
ncbi:MAG: right-handed parallel beta-helix repeat-containing protein [Planctomycetia bacterium]|nr:right-handed parallel beta-helix repeat-containing protein [Planctomycetia bacterium]